MKWTLAIIKQKVVDADRKMKLLQSRSRIATLLIALATAYMLIGNGQQEYA